MDLDQTLAPGSGMNPGRLVIVSRVLPFHSEGGMQFVAWDLALALRDLGTSVTVLTTRIPGKEARFVEDGIEVLAPREAPPRKYGRRWWRASRDVLGSRLAEVDAILSVSAGAYGLLPLRASKPELRFVLQAHGTSAGEFASKWRSRKPLQWLLSARNAAWIPRDLLAYRKFHQIVAVGDPVRKQFTNLPIRWFVSPDRVVTIENGVDTSCFRPDPALRATARESLGWSLDDLIVCTTSRLHPQKGISEAIRGFAAFLAKRGAASARARYLIIGDGRARADLQAQAERLLPPERIQFLGPVDRARIPALLNAADLFLFVTRRVEGLPLNVLEAAAVGLPQVLSKSLRDSCAHAGPVSFVDPGCPAEIADALEARLAGDEAEGPAARTSLLAERHALSTTAARYAQVLFPDRNP